MMSNDIAHQELVGSIMSVDPFITLHPEVESKKLKTVSDDIAQTCLLRKSSIILPNLSTELRLQRSSPFSVGFHCENRADLAIQCPNRRGT